MQPSTLTTPKREWIQRQKGFTLLEVVVSATVLMVLLGSIGAVFTAMTSGTTEIATALRAQNETHRTRRFLVEDLQMSDTVSTDSLGQPYCQIVDGGNGPNSKLIVRKVEDYEVSTSEGRVTPVFGSPISYYVSPEGRLVREQNGTEVTVAGHVSAAEFAVSPRGVISIKVSIDSDRHGEHEELVHHLRIFPRNSRTL